jgi:hypothetical protein
MLQDNVNESHLREAQQLRIHDEATRGAASRLTVRRCVCWRGIATRGAALHLPSRRGAASPLAALLLAARHCD